MSKKPKLIAAEPLKMGDPVYFAGPARHDLTRLVYKCALTADSEAELYEKIVGRPSAVFKRP